MDEKLRSKLVQEEMNRIVKEILGDDTNPMESLVITLMITKYFDNLGATELPAATNRKVVEILYRYFCMIEGLNKK